MAHEVWKDATGKDNMVYAGEVPWHGLGEQVPPTITGMELKDKLNLSPVALVNLFADPGDGSGLIKVSDKKGVMRTKENMILGVVGEGFTPIQDTEIIDTLEVLRAEGLCAFETAGILREGSRFFVMLNVPGGTLKLKTPSGKTDVVVNYLGVSHGHDGSLAFEFTPTNIRTVCQNTVTMARAQAKRDRVSFYIKHTANADARIKAAVEAYRKVIAFNAEVAEQAKKLMATPFDSNQIKALTERLFPVPAGKEDNIPAGVLKSRYEVLRLVTEGKGHQELGIIGTAWGAYNAVVEHFDWNRQTRGDKDLSASEKKNKMWEATQFNPQVYDKKLQALAIIEELSV
jgi:phage/plasmid-like protein (TIGR03299 family)